MIAGYREWTAASPPIPAQFASKGKFILTCPPQGERTLCGDPDRAAEVVESRRCWSSSERSGIVPAKKALTCRPRGGARDKCMPSNRPTVSTRAGAGEMTLTCNAAFRNTSGLAIDDGTMDGFHNRAPCDTALGHTDGLTINYSIGWPSVHRDAREREQRCEH